MPADAPVPGKHGPEALAQFPQALATEAATREITKHGTPIVFAPKDGPFGRYFAFRDPFGYTITPHTVAQS